MWLNLRKFFALAQISIKKCQITVLSIFSLDGLTKRVIWHLDFGDLSQSEKLSEIKPSLGGYRLRYYCTLMMMLLGGRCCRLFHRDTARCTLHTLVSGLWCWHLRYSFQCVGGVGGSYA